MLTLLLTLHWLSQQGLVYSLRDHIWGCVTIAVLVKTITMILAFKAMKPGIMKHFLVSRASNCVIPICSLIQLIICEILLATSPPLIDIGTHPEPINLIFNEGLVSAF